MITCHKTDRKLSSKLSASHPLAERRILNRSFLFSPLKSRFLEIQSYGEHSQTVRTLSLFHFQFSKTILDIISTTLHLQENKDTARACFGKIKKLFKSLENSCLEAFSRPNLSEIEFSMEFIFCLSNKIFSPLQTNILKKALEKKSIRVLNQSDHFFSSSEKQTWIDLLLNVFNRIELDSLLDEKNKKELCPSIEKASARNCRLFLSWYMKTISTNTQHKPGWNDLDKPITMDSLEHLFTVDSEQENINHAALVKEFDELLRKMDERKKVLILKDLRKKGASYGRSVLIRLVTNVQHTPSQKSLLAICQRTSLALFLALNEHFNE